LSALPLRYLRWPIFFSKKIFFNSPVLAELEEKCLMPVWRYAFDSIDILTNSFYDRKKGKRVKNSIVANNNSKNSISSAIAYFYEIENVLVIEFLC
jgi:hypothetical protein